MTSMAGRWPVQTGRHSVGHLQSSKAALYQQTKCFDIHIMLYICMYNCISISITIGAVIHSSMALRFMSTSSLVTSGIFFFLVLLLLLWQVMSCLLWTCSTWKVCWNWPPSSCSATLTGPQNYPTLYFLPRYSLVSQHSFCSILLGLDGFLYLASFLSHIYLCCGDDNIITIFNIGDSRLSVAAADSFMKFSSCAALGSAMTSPFQSCFWGTALGS